MAANSSKTRRRAARKHNEQEQEQQRGPTLEQLAAAASAPAPLVINLDNCRVIVRDAQGSKDGQKELLFAHLSGGVVFRALISPQLRKELVTLLSAPTGIVIPQSSADTPTA